MPFQSKWSSSFFRNTLNNHHHHTLSLTNLVFCVRKKNFINKKIEKPFLQFLMISSSPRVFGCGLEQKLSLQ
ncbi:hypothetical protein DERP_014182, partial [Dermatophagoides pteronyssinus]